MLFQVIRALACRAPVRVPQLPQSRGHRPVLQLSQCVPQICFSSAVVPLLRPSVGQLRQASALLRSGFFGEPSRWDQCAGAQRLRLRTSEHSRHNDPRGELQRRQFASACPGEALGPEAALQQRQQQQPSGSCSLAADSSAQTGGHPAAAAGLHHAQQGQQEGQQQHNGAGVPQPGGHQPEQQHHHAAHEGHAPHGHGHSHGVPPDGPQWKQRLGRYLESNDCHMIVISLVMLDLTIVVTELILGSLFTHGQPMPHAVHVAEEILSWSSIGILGLFATELLAKLVCFGSSYFAHSKWHMVDAVVVTLSLGLELTLKGVAGEAASLLMFFRLWKYTPEFMRVARHAPEVAEVARVARHSPEVIRVLSHAPEFARIFRHTPEFLRVFRHVPEAFRVFRHVPEFFRFVRHTPELFRLWRVARIAHASAEAMALATAKDQEELRQLSTKLTQELAAERGRRLDLEAEVAVLKQMLTPEQQAAVAEMLLATLPSSSSMDRVWEAGLSTATPPDSATTPDSDAGNGPGAGR